MKRILFSRLALLLALMLATASAGWAEEAALDFGESAGFEALIGAGEDLEVLAAPAEETVPEAPEAELPGEEAEPSEATDTAAQEVAAESEMPVMERSSLRLGVGETYMLTLTDGITPKGVGATFSSSNTKVATVNADTGEVKGVKTGSAVITMTIRGEVNSCTVKVLRAPSKLTLSSANLTLGVGEECSLSVKLPKNTASAISFSTSNARVATVDDDGHIVAVKKGTATITAKTFNGKKASCKVTVKAAPRSISLGESSLAMWVGGSYKLSPTLSKNSVGAYSYEVSDAAVLSVSGDTLKALAIGTATLTATTYNGKTAQMVVTVSRKPVYRALLVGESRFPGTGMKSLPAKKDVALMKKMLSSVRGGAGSRWSISATSDRTSAQIHEDILTAFAGAEEGDVSLFYISSHGDQTVQINSIYGEYAGCLQTYPDYNYANWYDRNTVTLPELASWLAEIPGQVVVVIDSCGSGAAIYTAKGLSAPGAFEPEAFGRAVVEAFGAEDKAVLAPGLEQGAFVVQNKFYVLTSAAYLESGWSSTDKYSYFTKWLTDGIGTKGAMAADGDKNKVTTLNELYKYVKKCASNKVFEYEGVRYKQHVQVYPSNSGLELFYRK